MEIPIKLQEMIDPNKECCCIYHFSNKCKEWAFNKGGIDITSGKRLGLDGWECLVFTGVIPCDCYEAETEPEAIFKATSYIMEQLKQKD